MKKVTPITRSIRLCWSETVKKKVEMNPETITPEIQFDQQRRYGDLTRDLPNMIFSMDAALKFTSFNHACEIFTGKSERDLIDKTMHEAFPDVAPLFGEECMVVLETKLAKVFPATTVSHEHSMLFNVHIHPTSGGIVVFFTDLTREITTELDGIEIVERLPKPAEDLREFVDALSEDVLGPMSKLRSLMLLSAENPDSTTDNHLLKRVAAVARRIAEEEDNKRKGHSFQEEGYVTFEAEWKRVKRSLANEISESKAFITCDFQVPGIITSATHLYTIIYKLVAAGVKLPAKGVIPMIHMQTYETSESLFFSVTAKGLASGGTTLVSDKGLYSEGKKVDEKSDLKELRDQAEAIGAALDVQHHINGNTITLIFPRDKT
jgi:hypothetical protein